MKLLTLLIPILLSLPETHAWGTLGHQTVAYIASNFVAPSTTTHFQTLLYNNSDAYLARVATWADSYRYTKYGKWSAVLHYIDAEDEVPGSCGVKYTRDCGEKGCVVAAIQNYTRQLLDPDLSKYNKYIAAKFIVHFLGDIHQPLHDENILIGGNEIHVNFTGKPTNLHHVWDTSIPEKLIGGYSMSDAQRWANTLTIAIKSGLYEDLAESWLDGMDLSDPLTTALGWAREANAFVCTTVMPDGAAALDGKELGDVYYEGAMPVVQLQIARAGYRLAAWLDLIASGADARTEL